MSCEGCAYNKKMKTGIDCVIFSSKIKDHNCYTTKEEAVKREEVIREYMSFKKPQEESPNL